MWSDCKQNLQADKTTSQNSHFMKIALFLSVFLLPLPGFCQESPPINPWKAAPPVVPVEVMNARVTGQTVLKGGGGAGGGDLIIQRIERPVFPPKLAVPAVVPQVPTKEALAARTARLALEPNELRLFSPTIVLFGDGVSLVRWGSSDGVKGYQQYAAWVRLDLSAINACPDLTVGRRRYCLMPMVFHATDRMVQQWKAPAPDSFQETTDIVLAEGDLENTASLEPLHALLAKFDSEGASIATAAAAIKAAHAARVSWEAANPAPPENTVIRFWTDGD
jgi:hypothetical protein